jgi:hypothetical protein
MGRDHFLSLAHFNRKQLTKPKFYVVAVQAGGENVLLGRRMANLKVLKQSKGLLATVWDGSTFNQLEASVATFATTFHWIKFRDRLYVLDAKAFHAEFRDVAAVRQAVSDNVDAITAKLPIKGADVLVERARANVGMSTKLARVAEQGIWTESQDELKAYAEEWKIGVEWDNEGLVFNGSIEHQWGILKLLDEDGTRGPVSGRHYESSAKRRVSS